MPWFSIGELTFMDRLSAHLDFDGAMVADAHSMFHETSSQSPRSGIWLAFTPAAGALKIDDGILRFEIAQGSAGSGRGISLPGPGVAMYPPGNRLLNRDLAAVPGEGVAGVVYKPSQAAG